MLFLSLPCVEIAELNIYFLKKIAEMTEGALWSTVLIKMVWKIKLSRSGGQKDKEQNSYEICIDKSYLDLGEFGLSENQNCVPYFLLVFYI